MTIVESIPQQNPGPEDDDLKSDVVMFEPLGPDCDTLTSMLVSWEADIWGRAELL